MFIDTPQIDLLPEESFNLFFFVNFRDLPVKVQGQCTKIISNTELNDLRIFI